MKKFIAVFSALLLVGCMAVLFYGCGANDEEMTTTQPTTTDVITTTPVTNDGMITDSAEEGDNGVIGDMVTDISEGMSMAMTDVSEDISDMME